MTPKPPPGFELDEGPEPPPGFELDAAPGKKSGVMPGGEMALSLEPGSMLTDGGQLGGVPTIVPSRMRVDPVGLRSFGQRVRPGTTKVPSFSERLKLFEAGAAPGSLEEPVDLAEPFGPFAPEAPRNVSRRRLERTMSRGGLGAMAEGQEAAGVATAKELMTAIDSGVIDTIRGLGSFLVGGGASATAAMGGGQGDEIRGFRDARRKDFNEDVGRLLEQPLTRVYQHYSKDNDPSNLQKFFDWLGEQLQKGAQAAERASGGAVKASDVEWLAEGFLSALGAKGTQLALGVDPRITLWKSKTRAGEDWKLRPDVGSSEAVDPTDPVATRRAAAERERTAESGLVDSRATLKEVDAYRNAEQEAYDLMRRGASIKEVEARLARAGKDSPLARAMAQLRARREQVAGAKSGFEVDGVEAEIVGPGPRWEPGPAPTYGADPALGAPRAPLNRNLLAGLGVAGAATLLYGNWDVLDAEEAAALIGIGALAGMPRTAPLGAVRNATDGTLVTLERLPGKRSEFSLDEIRQQLKRPDVTKAERDAFEAVLREHKGEKISAYDLVRGLSEGTEFAQLRAKDIDNYADYGLENIERALQAQQTARTTIYESPFEHSVNNHFGEKRYFAHTRSFSEEGVRHVVEIQSDFAQKSGKPLTAEEHAELDKQEAEILARMRLLRNERYGIDKSLTTKLDDLKAQGLNSTDSKWQEFVTIHRQMRRDLIVREEMQNLRVAELRQKRKGDEVGEAQARVAPMLKNWYKRIVDEEIATAVREKFTENPAWLKARLLYERSRANVDNFRKNQGNLWPDRLRDYETELAKLKQKLDAIPQYFPPPKVMRFATADTVAKVEGWSEIPENRRGLTGRQSLEADLAVLLRAEQTPAIAATVEAIRRRLTEMEDTPGLNARFSPEHQGIYDRYSRDVTKFLKSLGGKEVTDDKGHTWIEVPLEPKKGGAPLTRTQMFGVGAIAAGGGLLAMLTEDEQDAAAPIAAMALFAKSRSPAVRSASRGLIESAESVLGNLSTSIRNISESMLRPVRRHELNVLKHTYDRLKAVTPFVERLRGLPQESRAAISSALFSGAPNEAIQLVKSLDLGLLPEFVKVRKTLAELGEGLVDVGKLKGLRPEYFPRIVVDYEGLLKHLGADSGSSALEKRLFSAERMALTKTGEPLSHLDRSVIISDWLSQQMRGPGKAGFLKKRSIDEVTKDLLPFYAPADESLILYVRAATAEIERARFFGRHLVRDPETRKVDLDASIHNIVEEKLRNKEMSFEQAQRLKDLIWVRFGPGEQGMSGFVEGAKNLGYAALLAQPTSALVQLGDVATVVYAHGLLPTIKAVGQTLTGRGRITTADFGLIDNISAETASITGTARFVNKVFKLSGFNLVDRFGKSTAINAALDKYGRMAKTDKGVEAVKKKYGEYFGDDLGELLSDLRAGRRSGLVDELIFSELSDLQPVSRVEMPRKYLEMTNGRALYMLKSFMLKQADIVRRDVVGEWRKGNKLAATNKALRFSLALGIGGASTEFIRNWLLGRDDELEWSDVPANMLKTFMVSEYVLDQPNWQKKVEALGKSVLPPVGITADIVGSAELTVDWLKGGAEIEDGKAKAVRYVPIIGTALYHDALPGQEALGLEFGGAERSNRLREQRERRKQLRELRGE